MQDQRHGYEQLHASCSGLSIGLIYMKKILIVITTAFVPTGGLATVMLNYYRNMDRKQMRIDFASTNVVPEVLAEELGRNGDRYIQLPKRKYVPVYFNALRKLCRDYDVVHINGNSATAAIELLAARMAGVPVRIAHNHTTKTGHRIMHTLLLPVFRSSYTAGFACSEEAGNWLFGKGKFSVLRNAIDVGKYAYKEANRIRLREGLQIPQDAFVMGHVGKYNAPKNHFKLLEVFAEYQKSHQGTFLVCVGYGPLRAQIEEKIVELGLSGKVILTGERTDIPELLSTMDVFVFTSRWEGLGLAVIEAQASGLPCLLSDRVPQDVNLSDHVSFLPLEVDNRAWAEKVEELIISDREGQCGRNAESITKGGYNIKTEADKLRASYMG